jgi:hypothetical protein
MHVWLSVWDTSGRLDEVKLSPPPADVPAATVQGEQLARLLAVKYAQVTDKWLQLQVLDESRHSLAAGPERAAMEQAIQTAFRNPF